MIFAKLVGAAPKIEFRKVELRCRAPSRSVREPTRESNLSKLSKRPHQDLQNRSPRSLPPLGQTRRLFVSVVCPPTCRRYSTLCYLSPKENVRRYRRSERISLLKSASKSHRERFEKILPTIRRINNRAPLLTIPTVICSFLSCPTTRHFFVVLSLSPLPLRQDAGYNNRKFEWEETLGSRSIAYCRTNHLFPHWRTYG